MRYQTAVIVAAIVVAAPVYAQGEPMMVPVATDAALPVYDESSFDWDGFYAGIYGTGTATQSYGLEYGYGFNVGFSHAFDFVLVGGEVAFHPLGNDQIGTTYLQAVGRGGVLVTDNLLAYAAAGFGTDTGAFEGNHILAGVGIEYGFTESVSLRGQYLHGFPGTGSEPIDQLTFGAEFHF